ncbi:MAG TPA: heparinase, partial [Candidatus Hydrogenedentes bacterium]|nr:heparinase [Candidatus Hydrogenedentota bacterium]
MKWIALAGMLFLIISRAHKATAEQGADVSPAVFWPELLDRVKADLAFDEARKELVTRARSIAENAIIRRPYTLEDVGKNRTWLDGRSAALEDEIREQFALAMSDFAACGTLSSELPLLAAAYRLTGEAIFLERVIAQLEEMSAWAPLQRPGWTLYAPGHRLPADGKDGNWLATGCGVRAIGDTLEVLPDGALDAALLEKIRALLETEIAGVVDDWETQRPWFVSSHNPVTNQWVLPTEGLVRACLILGVDDHRDAYELGVKNLLEALDVHGPKGEFEEGFGYASFTVTSMLHAAHAMAVAGDRRAADHPFLKHFPTWFVHHFQPGKYVINCFDAGASYDAAAGSRGLLSLLAVCTSSPAARWALAEYVGGPSSDLPGLAARALPAVGTEAAPPLFAHYERAARVNWRSSWAEDATGVWVRGGHHLDQHDHQDRGHVNFIACGRPILIEAGTPSYHHKQ